MAACLSVTAAKALERMYAGVSRPFTGYLAVEPTPGQTELVAAAKHYPGAISVSGHPVRVIFARDAPSLLTVRWPRQRKEILPLAGRRQLGPATFSAAGVKPGLLPRSKCGATQSSIGNPQ